MTYNLLTVLNLFEGEGGGASGASAAGTGEGTASQGDNTISANTQRKSGAYANVLFGKQEAAEEPAQTEAAAQNTQTETVVTSDALEAKQKAFDDLIKGEYKDIYTQRTQEMINRRFKETKGLQDQVSKSQPVIDMLMSKYKVENNDLDALTKAIENDDAYWSEAADEAGMSVSQYKEFQKLQRENKELMEEQRQREGEARANAQVQAWYQQGEALKQTFPNFNLETESQNPEFIRLLQSGLPVEHAYKVIHMDEIVTDAMRTTAAAAEKRVVQNVRAKGSRPPENGTIAQSAFTIKDDVSKLTKEDRAEAVRRARMGESIVF